MERTIVKRVSTQMHTRELDRLVSHANLKRAGIRKANKHDYVGPPWQRHRIGSYFANHWRETVNVPTIDLRRTKKA